MTMDYRLGWKAERGYWEFGRGFLPDEECDWWEEARRQHASSLQAALPKSEDAWRRLFGLLPPESRAKVDKDEVRGRVDMADLAGRYGAQNVRIFGKRAAARCPFHEDRLASFSMDLERRLWYCFAGCGGGDCFDFVMRAEECKFGEAVRILNREY